MRIKYPCLLAPGGLCPDCTSDGPPCDFDMCPYEEEFFEQMDEVIDNSKEETK